MGLVLWRSLRPGLLVTYAHIRTRLRNRGLPLPAGLPIYFFGITALCEPPTLCRLDTLLDGIKLCVIALWQVDPFGTSAE